jgi:hypothetical protein
MLKIKNYNKLYKKDVGEWRIGRIDETSTSYIIQFNKPNGDKMQVMLERNGIGSNNGADYELWRWSQTSKSGAVAQTATPIRMMLTKEKIKDMNTFLGHLQFIIK